MKRDYGMRISSIASYTLSQPSKKCLLRRWDNRCLRRPREGGECEKPQEEGAKSRIGGKGWKFVVQRKNGRKIYWYGGINAVWRAGRFSRIAMEFR